MNSFLHVNNSLKELLPGLPRALKVAATYMLEHPGEIATLSMRSIASHAGVSQPNFARLAKALGYESYSELREVYCQQVQKNDFSEYHLRAENLQRTDTAEGARELWKKFQSTTISNVTAIFDSIDPGYFASIARILNDSKTIYLVGMQGSAQFSGYAEYIGGMASGKFRLVRGDGGVLADAVFEIDEGDAMVVFSHQPCAHAAIQLAILAHERGATVIAVTDSPVSPISLEADHVLLAPNNSPLLYESYVGMTVLIEALVGFFTIGQPHSTIERIKKIEADRKLLGEYWMGKQETGTG